MLSTLLPSQKNTYLGRKAQSKSMLMSRLSRRPQRGALLYESSTRTQPKPCMTFFLTEVRSSLQKMKILVDIACSK